MRMKLSSALVWGAVIMGFLGCAFTPDKNVQSDSEMPSAGPGGFAEALRAYNHLSASDKAPAKIHQGFYFRKPISEFFHLGNGYYRGTDNNSLMFIIDGRDREGALVTVQFILESDGNYSVNSNWLEDQALIRSAFIGNTEGFLDRIGEIPMEDPCVEVAFSSGEFADLLECLFAGGSGSGDATLTLPSLIDELFDADCSEQGGIVSKGDSRRTQRSRVINVGMRNRNRNMTMSRLVGNLREAFAELRNARAVLETGIGSTGDILLDDLAVQDAESHMETAYNELENYIMNDPELKKQVENAQDPIPGEEGRGMIDGHCQKEDIDSRRGTLFRNTRFCPSRDYLKCLAEEQDPVRRITVGKCVTREGQAGGNFLVCGEQADDSINTPNPQVDPNDVDTCQKGDELCWTDPNAPPTYGGQLAERYVDILDLGPFFGAICAVGGCPIVDPRLSRPMDNL